MTLQATATGSPKGMGRLLLAATLATTFALGVGAGVALRDATLSSERTTEGVVTAPEAHIAPTPERGGMAELYAEQFVSRTRSFDSTDTLGGMAELYREQQRAATGARPAEEPPIFFILDSADQLGDPAVTSLLAGGMIVGSVVASAGDNVASDAVAKEHERRRDLGLPGMVVIDLRVR